MSNPTPALTPDVILPSNLVDRLAALLVWLQNEDPANVLFHLSKMREAAGKLQAELQQHAGPWVICHLCEPAKRLHMSEVYQHDVEVHNAYRSK